MTVFRGHTPIRHPAAPRERAARTPHAFDRRRLWGRTQTADAFCPPAPEKVDANDHGSVPFRS
jgi:hypothetical protein